MIAPMTRHSVFFSAPLFLAVLCSAVSSASAQAPLVAPKLMQRALSEGSVRVIVELGAFSATTLPLPFSVETLRPHKTRSVKPSEVRPTA